MNFFTILIFGSWIFSRSLFFFSFFAETTEIFVDATFKTRPHHDIFSQLLNVLVIYKGYSIPVMHVLMTSKDQGLYVKCMERFKDLVGQDFKPESAMSDYEKAILNTMQIVFPESRVSGCRFHFNQAGTPFVTFVICNLNITRDRDRNNY